MANEAHKASPQPAVFRTAFGFRLFFPAAMLLLMASVVFPGSLPGPDWVSTLAKVFVAASVVVILGLMLSTKYRVEDGALHVRMGPFKRSIAIDSITSAVIDYRIAPGWWVDGLGSDIMRISYEGGLIDITPKDAEGLLAAIGFPSRMSRDAEPPASPAGS